MDQPRRRRRRSNNQSLATDPKTVFQGLYRRRLVSTMLSLVLVHERSRAGKVSAFSVSRSTSRAVQRADEVRRWSSSQSVESTTTTGDHSREEGETSPSLILPSHPDIRIRSVMAPMVAASDYPFRQFLRQHCGVDLTYTQMLHSKNFCNDATFRKAHLDFWETGIQYPNLLRAQVDCLGGLPLPTGPSPNEASAPLMVQLAGNDVDSVVQAANMAMELTDGKISGFDLNCGCPQGIARRGNYGAFLMEQDFDRVCDILTALRRSLPLSTVVSAKIRLPVEESALEYRIPRLVETGVHFLTVHGRTLKENKTSVGPCRVDRIRMAVEAAHKVDPNFPIVANGGMENYNDVQDILQSTGAVAAMSSEALLETPNLFMKTSRDLTARETLDQQFSFARNYLNVCSDVVPPLPGVLGMKKGGSSNVIRGHLFKFLHRYLTEHPDIRDRLGPDGITLPSIPQSLEIVQDLEDRFTSLSDEELEACGSSSTESSWYRRHRKAARRVHRRGGREAAEIPEKQSLEERKRQIQKRIEQMQENKTSKTTKFV